MTQAERGRHCVIDLADDGIATIANAGALNILGIAAIEDLTRGIESLRERSDLCALVMRGTGDKAFIGGADIKAMAALTRATAETFITGLRRLCDALRHFPAPVIARMPGWSLGGGLEVALAFAQPNTSARDELVPVAIAVIFVAGALLALGVRLLRRGVPGGLVATFLGATTLVYIVSARPTVVCEPNGASESSGPWWMPYGGGMRSVGGGDASGTTGRIERGDGVVITYRCDGRELVEFEIRR